MKKIIERRGAYQQFRDECDVNSIMRRAKNNNCDALGADVTHLQYADVSNVPDFVDINNKMISARNAFFRLDPKIRRQFDHDPVQFLQFVSNPENGEEMERLGLLVKKPEPKKDVQSEMLEELKKINAGSSKKDPGTLPT